MDLAENLRLVRERMAAACERAGRPLDSVTLMGVTKGQPPEAVEEAGRCGLTLLGENKVQEAKAKIPRCSRKLHWHMIGHLQSNKCREVIGLFEMIQSVDSLHLAEELNRRAEQAARTLPILLEVNIAGEASKFGYAPERLLAEFKEINALPRLEVHGLMTIPPWTPHPERVRPVFRRVRELKAECEQALGAPLEHLSMGMSGDFEVAIEEGATMIRVGTALFGERRRSGSGGGLNGLVGGSGGL